MRLGETTYDETWEATDPCYGHNPTNFQPFTSLFGDDHDECAPGLGRVGWSLLLLSLTRSRPPAYQVLHEQGAVRRAQPGERRAALCAWPSIPASQVARSLLLTLLCPLFGALRPHITPCFKVYDNFEWPHCTFLGYRMTN